MPASSIRRSSLPASNGIAEVLCEGLVTSSMIEAPWAPGQRLLCVLGARRASAAGTLQPRTGFDWWRGAYTKAAGPGHAPRNRAGPSFLLDAGDPDGFGPQRDIRRDLSAEFLWAATQRINAAGDKS